MQILSLSKKIAELDQLEARQQTAACFSQFLKDVAEQLIEVEKTAAGLCRQGLHDAARTIQEAPAIADVSDGRISARNFLEEFRRSSEIHLARLRETLAAATRTLQQIVSSSAREVGTYHRTIQADIEHLRSVSQTGDLSSLRREVRRTTDDMTNHLNEMRYAHDAVVTQLRDEILTLHREIEKQGPERTVPIHSGNGMRRGDFETSVRLRAGDQQGFCLTVLWMANLGQLFRQYSSEVVLQLIGLAESRIATALEHDSFWARWEDDCFIVCFPESKEATIRLAEELSTRLSRKYRLVDRGFVHDLHLRIVAGTVEHASGTDIDQSFEAVSRLLDCFQR